MKERREHRVRRVTLAHQETMERKETKAKRETQDKRAWPVFRERRENQGQTEKRATRDPMETVHLTTTCLVTVTLTSSSNTLRRLRHQNARLTSNLYGLDTHLCSSKAMATDFPKILEVLALA